FGDRPTRARVDVRLVPGNRPPCPGPAGAALFLARGVARDAQRRRLALAVLAQPDGPLRERNLDPALVEDALDDAVIGAPDAPLLARPGPDPHAHDDGVLDQRVHPEPFQVPEDEGALLGVRSQL